MIDNEEILDLQTKKPKIVNLEDIRKLSKKRRPSFRKKRVQNFVLYVIDSIISLVFVAPMVVCFWRGTWVLLDIYTHLFPPYETGALGICVHMCFILIRQFVKDYFEENNNRAKRHPLLVITRRFYTYVYSVMSVMQWRGCWTAFDHLFGDGRDGNLFWVIITTVLSTAALIVLKSLTNSLATPCILILDSVEACYNIPTRFRVMMTEKTTLYVLDCIFSVLIVGTLVVFVWRGGWVLLDIFLFPNNEELSAWSSLIIGYIIVALAFMLQPGMRWICDRLQGAMRLIAADLFLVFSLCGTINLWRGIWMLLNLYLLPDETELGCWITHWLCLVLLILLGCSNSLLVRGVYIDAEEPAGKCVIFPCYYLRLIFQQERAKKIAKHLQLDTISRKKQDPMQNNTTVNHITAMSQLVIGEESFVYVSEVPTEVPNKNDPLYAPSICGENQLLYPGTQKADWICDCAPGFVYYPKKDGCFAVYRKGPCEEGEYLILHDGEFVPKCEKNPCNTDGVVEYKGICHPLEKSGGPCKRKNDTEPISILSVIKSTLKLHCVASTSGLALIGIPPACPPGSRRSNSNDCRPAMTGL